MSVSAGMPDGALIQTRTEAMTIETFEASLGAAAPPLRLEPLLLALWQDGRGDWDAAHQVAQDVDTPDGAWVHAYLHRKEGDAANAAYWYRRAGRPVAAGALRAEWRAIATALLADREGADA
jgi:hypothetical protein